MSTSLADELLDDLENESEHASDGERNLGEVQKKSLTPDADDELRTTDRQNITYHATAVPRKPVSKGEAEETSNSGDAADLLHNADRLDLRPGSQQRIKDICPLLDKSSTKTLLRTIDQYCDSPGLPVFAGDIEASPEYQVIVQANNLTASVDNEMLTAHKYIRHHYKSRFPELESVVTNPWEFVQAVHAIGNHDNPAKARLDQILPQGTIVVISMQASTTRGRKLPAEMWHRVEEACRLIFDLNEVRQKIQRFVESRMSVIAPNLTSVVGSQVATKLLGVAGGLMALTKIPACNIMLLGASKTTSAGMSTAFSGRHRGFIAHAPLVENTPEEYKREALSMVSAKAILAARVDAGGSYRQGTYGEQLVQELENKLAKLQDPPPAKLVKALPIPKEGGNKRHRGGRRARKIKERLGMTDLRKMQNRVRFGGEAEEEAGAFDETVGMGMIDSRGDTGRLRALAADSSSKTRMSKRNTQRIQAIQQGTASHRLNALDDDEHARHRSLGDERTRPTTGSSSGTASSLAFTPVQGLELVDPSTRMRRVEEANAKWFKEGSFSLVPGRTTAPAASSTGAMGPSDGHH